MKIEKVKPEQIDGIKFKRRSNDEERTIYSIVLWINSKLYNTGLSSYKMVKPEYPIDENYLDIYSGFVTILENKDPKEWLKNHCFKKTYGDGSIGFCFAYTDEDGYILDFSGIRHENVGIVALK